MYKNGTKFLWAIFASILFGAILCNKSAFSSDSASPPLSPESFRSVPDSYRPWCYYWWLKGNVDEEQITNDLEAMKRLGFGGLLLFDSRGYHEDAENHIPVPMPIRHEFMSDSWRALVGHLLREANRLGLKVSVNISDTGGHLRGPWDFGGEGPRRLVWTEGNFNGPKPIALSLEVPENQPYYHDAALVAVRVNVEPAPDRESIRFGEKWSPVEKPADGGAVALETVDLTPFVHDKTLTWDMPEGAWKILRFGSAVTGDTGSVDILNEKIVEKYFDRMAGTLLDEAGPLAGTTLTHFYNVSWEGSEPDWTDGFDRYFAEKRGYELAPYFPALRGLVVTDSETTRRFLTDFYQTVADAFREHCYRKIGALCHERGVGWHSENGGPWNRNSPMFSEADMLTFWGENDFPQGEFWVAEETPHALTNTRFAANASRIYGRDRTAVEAFTHMVRHWTISPRTLKPAADRNFIDGANHFIWHTFTASPPEAGKPGYEYFAGTHINSNVTWHHEAAGFITYLARCQYLLRQGHYAADLAVYASDRNQINWGRGEPWSGGATIAPPAWFAYDLLDTPSLVKRLEWRDGLFRLTMPNQAETLAYRLLVFDPAEEELPPSAVEKIVALVEAGGSVLLGARRPTRCRSLADGATHEATDEATDGEGDRRLNAAVEKLWGSGSANVRKLGAGTIYQHITAADALAAENILPDFVGPFETTKRIFGGDTLYFVTGSGEGEMTFRASGTPELWDAVTGSICAADYEPLADSRTRVALDLPENGSVFVLFRSTPTEHLSAESPAAWKSAPITGTWTVAFDPKWGGPEETVFETLAPWNESANEGIRYYSGSAVYRNTFTLNDEQARNQVRLALGSVEVIARVTLNGVDCGTVWTAPWTVDLSNAVKPGANQLEVEVTNVWANRLIGDAGLKPEERFTHTNVQYYAPGVKHRPHQGFAPDDPLRPSGLIGPVSVETAPR